MSAWIDSLFLLTLFIVSILFFYVVARTVKTKFLLSERGAESGHVPTHARQIAERVFKDFGLDYTLLLRHIRCRMLVGAVEVLPGRIVEVWLSEVASRLPEAELEFLLAHEAAHIRLGHTKAIKRATEVAKRLLGLLMPIMLLGLLAGTLLGSAWPLAIIGGLLFLALLLLNLVSSRQSVRNEIEADQLACIYTRNPAAARSLFLRKASSQWTRHRLFGRPLFPKLLRLHRRLFPSHPETSARPMGF